MGKGEVEAFFLEFLNHGTVEMKEVIYTLNGMKKFEFILLVHSQRKLD